MKKKKKTGYRCKRASLSRLNRQRYRVRTYHAIWSLFIYIPTASHLDRTQSTSMYRRNETALLHGKKNSLPSTYDTICTTAAGRRAQPDLESSTRAPRAEEAGTGRIMPWPEDPPKPVTLDDLADWAQRTKTVYLPRICTYMEPALKAPPPQDIPRYGANKKRHKRKMIRVHVSFLWIPRQESTTRNTQNNGVVTGCNHLRYFLLHHR